MAWGQAPLDMALARWPLAEFPYAERALRGHIVHFSLDALMGRNLAWLWPGRDRRRAALAYCLAMEGHPDRAKARFEKLALEVSRRSSRRRAEDGLDMQPVRLLAAAAGSAFLIGDADAADAYGRARREDPEDPELAILHGLFLIRSGQPFAAKAPLQASIDIWTSRLPPESDRGYDANDWRSEYGQRIREAEKLLQTCEQQD